MGDWLERGLRFFPVLLYSACAAAYSQGTMYRGPAFSARRVLNELVWSVQRRQSFASASGASIRTPVRSHEMVSPLE